MSIGSVGCERTGTSHNKVLLHCVKYGRVVKFYDEWKSRRLSLGSVHKICYLDSLKKSGIYLLRILDTAASENKSEMFLFYRRVFCTVPKITYIMDFQDVLYCA